MEPLFIIILGLLSIGTIVLLVHHFSPKAIILRKLKKLPHQRVGSLRTNSYSKIEGNALNIEIPLIAPLSKRKCVFYKIRIEKKVNRGKNSRWETILDQQQIQDFFIDQNGERVIIFPTKKPKNYFDYLVTDKTTSSGTFNDPTPEFLELLNSYNIKSEGFFGFNKQLRYEEAIIEVGERVTVAGHIKWVELEQPITNYNYSSIASITAKGKDKILITDSPKALRKNQKL